MISREGIHDVYITEGNVDGEGFSEFVRSYLLPILMPFNNINLRSVVIMDNASIHHVQEVSNLIETQAGARIHYLLPYSPDLNPAEGVFGQIKYIMKQNHKLFQVCSAPRAMIAFILEWLTKKIASDTFHAVVTYFELLCIYNLHSQSCMHVCHFFNSMCSFTFPSACVMYPLLLAFPKYTLLRQ